MATHGRRGKGDHAERVTLGEARDRGGGDRVRRRSRARRGADTERLYFLAGHLNLDGTAAEGWKLKVADTGPVAVPAPQ